MAYLVPWAGRRRTLSSTPPAKWSKDAVVSLMKYRLEEHCDGFIEAKNKAKITATWKLIAEKVNKDECKNFSMLQVKTKFQGLKKQYRDIINLEAETGNCKAAYKPEYWEEMLMYFANRDGLLGQSIINSNPNSNPLKDLSNITSENESKLELGDEVLTEKNVDIMEEDNLPVIQATQVMDIDVGDDDTLEKNGGDPKDQEAIDVEHNFETISAVERKH